MAIMKTLTVGDETYTVRDPEAVSFEQIQLLTPTQQQTARGNIGAMSAKEAADMMCPAFTESGSIVICEPVDGYPLDVEWETKNLCAIDSVDTAVTVKETKLFSGNLNPPLVISGDVSQLTVTSQAGLVDAVWGDGTSTPISTTMLADGYVCTDKVLTALEYKNWCNATGTAKIQVEKGTTATPYEPYAETATITRCGKNLCATDVVNLPGDGMNKTIWSGRLSAPLTVSADLSEVQGDFTHGGAFISYVVDGNTKYASLGSCGTGVKIESGTLTQMKVVNYGKFSGTARIRLETGLVKTAYEPYNGGTFAPGEPITAISGVNTIYADAGVVTVTGKANPAAIIEKLTNAILSLGGNV